MTTTPDRNLTTRRFSQWRNRLRWASLPVLTGTLLAVMARPVFWQDALYLDGGEVGGERTDVGDRPTTLEPSRRTRRRAISGPSMPIDRPLTASDRLPEPTSESADLPSRSTTPSTDSESPQMLRFSRGFHQESPAPQAAPRFPTPEEAPVTAVAEPEAAEEPAEIAAAQPMRSITESLAALLLPPELPPVASEPSPLTATIPDRARDRSEETSPSLPSETSPSGGDAAIADELPGERPPVSDVGRPGTNMEPEAPSADLVDPDTDLDVTPEQTASIPDLIRVDQFVINGSTVFEPEDLAAIALSAVLDPAAENAAGELCDVQGPLTPPGTLYLTPSQLVQASNAIEQCYILGGYINSGAFIAETELTEPDDSTIEISVVEGRLEAISIEMIRSGLFGLHPSYVESRLRAAIGDPFNLEALVEAVRLLELDPLISQISTELVPGTQTGTSILDARVMQDDGFDVALFTDNERSPSVGSVRRGISLSQANLLGLGDRFSLGYNFTGGSDELSLGYTVPINPRNGTLGFNFTTTDSEVIEEPFTVLDILSNSTTYEFSYRQPLLLTPRQEFAISLKLSRRESQAEFLEGILGESIPFPGTGADAEGRTRITALRFGQEWITRNSREVIALLSEFSLGIDAFGSTIQPIPPDSRFFLWRGQGQWVRRLGPDSLFILRGNIQLADRPLLPNEQFSFGGQQAGRGYRLNTLLRDSGWFLSSEFRFPLFRIPEDNIMMQVAPFFDIGGGWNRGEAPETLFLTSTGLGLIFEFDDSFSARLDWGIPLSDFETTGSDLQDSGIHFSIRLTQ